MMNLLFFLTAYAAEIVGSTAGFGSSTVLQPVALLFFDFKTALLLVALFHIFGNISRFSFFRKSLNVRMLKIFGIPAVIATFIGAVLVSYTSIAVLKGLLGIFLVLYSVISLWKEKFKAKPTPFNAAIGGISSGFLAGLIGTGGALRGAFLNAFGIPKEQYIATAALIALAVDVTRIPLYFAQGFLKPELFWYIPALFVVALLGSATGKQIVSRIPQKIFRKIVLYALIGAGILFVYSFFT